MLDSNWKCGVKLQYFSCRDLNGWLMERDTGGERERSLGLGRPSGGDSHLEGLLSLSPLGDKAWGWHHRFLIHSTDWRSGLSTALLLHPLAGTCLHMSSVKQGRFSTSFNGQTQWSDYCFGEQYSDPLVCYTLNYLQSKLPILWLIIGNWEHGYICT